MRIYIARHGEAGDDIEDAYGGAANFRLTDHGRDQARELGKRLADRGIEAVFSSPLARALETAELVAQSLPGDIAPVVVEDLKERNSYGVLSGVPKARAAELFDYLLADLSEKPGYSREPLLGAEDFGEFIDRVRRAFDQVVQLSLESDFEAIAIVTHGKFTRGLFEHVLRAGDTFDPDLSTATCVDISPMQVLSVDPVQ